MKGEYNCQKVYSSNNIYSSWHIAHFCQGQNGKQNSNTPLTYRPANLTVATYITLVNTVPNTTVVHSKSLLLSSHSDSDPGWIHYHFYTGFYYYSTIGDNSHPDL